MRALSTLSPSRSAMSRSLSSSPRAAPSAEAAPALRPWGRWRDSFHTRPLPHGPVAANPALATNGAGKRDSYTWEALQSARLFVDGVSADDFTQASLGNCALLASLASIADARPDLIEQMVRDNRDGTFTVTFHQPGPDGKTLVPVEVTVDDKLPLNERGERGYTRARNPQELWLSIIEKAYAVFRGGSYDAIESQSPAVVMMHLTGGRKSVYGTQHGDDVLLRQLEDALTAGRFIVAGNFPIQDDPATPGKEGNMKGLVVPHAYSVLSVSERDGERYVTVRNPWGHHEVGRDGKDDGTFELPLSLFAEQFAYCDVVG
jgi:hypothetical protein